MIAHNNDRRRDIFQIAPGGDRQSLWLAYQAHAAARMWAAGATIWNANGKRQGLGRGRRSPHGAAIPLMAQHLAPAGEVRFRDDPRSTLFNTDGQIFADAGIPTVLFMENYDINREGYHDTLRHDGQHRSRLRIGGGGDHDRGGGKGGERDVAMIFLP